MPVWPAGSLTPPTRKRIYAATVGATCRSTIRSFIPFFRRCSTTLSRGAPGIDETTGAGDGEGEPLLRWPAAGGAAAAAGRLGVSRRLRATRRKWFIV